VYHFFWLLALQLKRKQNQHFDKQSLTNKRRRLPFLVYAHERRPFSSWAHSLFITSVHLFSRERKLPNRGRSRTKGRRGAQKASRRRAAMRGTAFSLRRSWRQGCIRAVASGRVAYTKATEANERQGLPRLDGAA